MAGLPAESIDRLLRIGYRRVLASYPIETAVKPPWGNHQRSTMISYDKCGCQLATLNKRRVLWQRDATMKLLLKRITLMT